VWFCRIVKYRKVSSSIVARYCCIRSCCITCRSVAVYRAVRSGPVLSQCRVLVRPVSSQCNVLSCGARSCRSVSNVPSRCVSSHCLALFGRVAMYSFARISHVQSHCQVTSGSVVFCRSVLCRGVMSSRSVLSYIVMYCLVRSHCLVLSHNVQSHCHVVCVMSRYVALLSTVPYC
jgi:hypothetical protein